MCVCVLCVCVCVCVCVSFSNTLQSSSFDVESDVIMLEELQVHSSLHGGISLGNALVLTDTDWPILCDEIIKL